MMGDLRFLLAASNQQLYVFSGQRFSDIADRVGCVHVEALSSTTGEFQFWVTPSLRGGRTFNGPATTLFYAFTGFSAAEVPLLRGNIVITSSDAAGRATSLTDEHFEQVRRSMTGLGRRAEVLLGRRLRRAQHQDRRDRGRARGSGSDTWAPLC